MRHAWPPRCRTRLTSPSFLSETMIQSGSRYVRRSLRRRHFGLGTPRRGAGSSMRPSRCSSFKASRQLISRGLPFGERQPKTSHTRRLNAVRDNSGSVSTSRQTCAIPCSSNVVRSEPMPEQYNPDRTVFGRRFVVSAQPGTEGVRSWCRRVSSPSHGSSARRRKSLHLDEDALTWRKCEMVKPVDVGSQAGALTAKPGNDVRAC